MVKVGRKSLLWGSHQFLLHPLLVLLGYRIVYGHWPKQVPEYFAILMHDWGYWHLDNMDGYTGKLHPDRGALMVSKLFDPPYANVWYWYTAGHSRYYVERTGHIPGVSPLMRADKIATCLLPVWLFWLLITISGEKPEYMTYHEEATGRNFRTAFGYCRDIQREWWRMYGPGIPGGYLAGAEDPDYIALVAQMDVAVEEIPL